MSKTKSASKAVKPAKTDVLSKVKNGGVTKPAKEEKSKKDLAKKVVEKEDKKSKKEKKKVKEPTPEPSSEEEDSASSESDSSESESEAEVEVKKPAVNGKAAKKPAAKEDSSSESESDSDASASSDSSDDEAPPAKKTATREAPKKTNGVKVPAKKDDSSDDSSEEEADSSDSSDDEADAKPKTNGAPVEADSDSDDESGSDSSDSSSDDDEEEQPAVKANKRKAEEAVEAAPKKAKTEVATEGGEEGKKNLFVGNLSWNVDEAWLRETFEEHGELSGCRVMMDKATGRAKGFGYVEYTNAEDAAKAYAAKTGFELDGRTINLDWASAKPDNRGAQDDRRKSYGDQLSEPTDTLFVGNIAFDVGQEQVSEAFAPYGTIMSVRLPTQQEDGRPKGFGYVTFTSVDEAKAALEAMQGAYISSRPVRLDYSQPRPERSEGGGRGRGGFGGGFGGRGGGGRGRGGDRGRGGRGSFGGRGRGAPRGGSRGTTNRGGFGDFAGQRQTFD